MKQLKFQKKLIFIFQLVKFSIKILYLLLTIKGIDLKIGNEKKGIRRIFDGQATFDEFEMKKIYELWSFFKKSKKKIQLDENLLI